MFPSCWQNSTLTLPFWVYRWFGFSCSATSCRDVTGRMRAGLGHPLMTEFFRFFKLAKTIHTHYDQNLIKSQVDELRSLCNQTRLAGKIHHLVGWFSQQTKPSLIYRSFPSHVGRPSLTVHHYCEWFSITPACFRFMAASVYHITPQKSMQDGAFQLCLLVYKPHWHSLTLVIFYIYLP